ncbi:hypothetical protein ANCCAN_27554 [Ancylostoma caninum]|uniref:RSE1/DDB1/CPSF1 C-terminal domain-containing protein n=1 Tax=Ancylostoma caninum TaxID=29170 RepID=A0A368F6Q0_ANCCA|nr:hypothetical protein ANCCAN_27554 [Ancylostoma caninum]
MIAASQLYCCNYLSNFPVQITGIQSTGQRIIVTDSQESVHFVRYRKAENQLVIFCDDTTPRYVTTCCVLDYNTVAVGDKFGSVSIVGLYSGYNLAYYAIPAISWSSNLMFLSRCRQR